MHIVGGTYLEYVVEPSWHELFGSGLRAACALSHLSTNIHFHSCIDENNKAVLEARAEAFKVHLQTITIRPKAIAFEYFTPLSSPAVVGYSANDKTCCSIKITSNDAILRYGILEGDAIVHGKKVVYDPQSPIAPKTFYDNGSTAEELAVILNRREAIALANTDNDEEIIKKLFVNPSTKVIIIKNGPWGATLYCREKGKIQIPAYKTETVFSIGSGDIFSAFFAFFWAEQGTNPELAAHNASIATAIYVSSHGANLPLTEKQIVKNSQNPCVYENIDTSSKKVYLAGPFFTLESKWFIEETLRIFLSMGISVFSPLHTIGFGSPQEIYTPDIEGLLSCDIVFANLCGLDSGTLYEIGYARAKGIPVVAFIQNYRQEDLTMLIGGECKIFQDYTSAIYNTIWDVLAL